MSQSENRFYREKADADISKHGRPAFPVPGLQNDETFNGMCMRDYFAAHAPDQIPEWFTGPKSPIVIPPMPSTDSLSEADAKTARGWLHGDIEDLPDHLLFYGEAVVARGVAIEQKKADENVRRYFAWRWYYAGMMILEGGL